MVRMFFEGMHGQLGQPCFLQKCLQTEGERAHLLLDFSLEVDAFAAVTEVELEQEVDLIKGQGVWVDGGRQRCVEYFVNRIAQGCSVLPELW